MTDTSLIFNIIAIDRATSILGKVTKGWGAFGLAIGASAVYAGAKFVGMAADFQTGITRLQTGAGESAANLKMVSDGILDMAGQVGESTKDLNAGMYLVESAGFHAANGLEVLRVAAQGAKVGNADMATVADAVTTALNAYHLGADHATQATNALIAAEGQGKTNLEALSASLSTVAPIASLAGVSLNELLGAMATMTAQGTPAADAATYLKQTIGQLSNPTAKARAEMKALGLDATQVSMNLGKRGLANTLMEITDAIQAHMGPAGTVLIEQLRKASGNATKFQQILANLPPTQQTFIGALATMVGGTKSMQAALELTGANMKVFQANTDVINQKVKAGGSSIEGWSTVQNTLNVRMAEAKGTVEALGIRIGNALLPKAQTMLGVTMSIVGWFTKHKTVANDLAVAIGVLAAGILLYKLYTLGASAATVAWGAVTKGAAAAQWLLNFAMDANPIGLLVIAIGLLVAGIVLLWNNSAGFRDFWIGAWHVISGAAVAVFDWVKHNWPLLLAILTGPIGLAVLFIVDHWNTILHFIEGVPGKIGHIAVGMWDGVKNAFKAAINWIIDAWNGLHFSIPGFSFAGVHVAGFNLGLPQLPHLAQGGTAVTDGLAMVGERGAEVVKLRAGDSVYPHGTTPRQPGGRDVVYLRPGNELGALLIQVLRAAIGARGGKTSVVLDS